MKYRDITAEIPSARVDEAGSIADMLDFGGLYIEDYSDMMENDIVKAVGLVDEELLAKDRTKAKLHIYIEEDKDAEECVSFLSERFAAAGIPAVINVSFIDEEDYTNCWKQYYKPLRIGRRIVVIPEWETYNLSEGDIPLYINPGMAFGTGTHETTFMCVEHLQEIVKAGDSVLDIGCGSGILSIASLLCGADEVFACDIDEGAVKVSRENAALNAYNGRFESVYGNILDDDGELSQTLSGRTYDVVVANIVADVIIALSAKVRRYMKPGGVFVMSGIIAPRFDDVKKALEANGFTLLESFTKKDWVCAVAR